MTHNLFGEPLSDLFARVVLNGLSDDEIFDTFAKFARQAAASGGSTDKNVVAVLKFSDNIRSFIADRARLTKGEQSVVDNFEQRLSVFLEEFFWKGLIYDPERPHDSRRDLRESRLWVHRMLIREWRVDRPDDFNSQRAFRRLMAMGWGYPRRGTPTDVPGLDVEERAAEVARAAGGGMFQWWTSSDYDSILPIVREHTNCASPEHLVRWLAEPDVPPALYTTLLNGCIRCSHSHHEEVRWIGTAARAVIHTASSLRNQNAANCKAMKARVERALNHLTDDLLAFVEMVTVAQEFAKAIEEKVYKGGFCTLSHRGISIGPDSVEICFSDRTSQRKNPVKMFLFWPARDLMKQWSAEGRLKHGTFVLKVHDATLRQTYAFTIKPPTATKTTEPLAAE